MMPGPYPIVLYRGDSYSWLVEIWQDQHKRHPANLTGAKAKAEIRDEAGGRLRAQLDCQVQLPNRIIVTLSARQSEALTQDAGAWDLQVTQIDKVTTIVRGPVSIIGDVTDSRLIDRAGDAPLRLAAPPPRAALLPALQVKGYIP
jgi:hypothetical protein